MDCTWKDCTKTALCPLVAKDGLVWANLCTDHNTQLDAAIASGEPKKILSSWIKAKGGAKAAAAQMMREGG